jgi:hypothetical protein
MEVVEYGRDGQTLYWNRQILEADLTLRFAADEVREERTGIHARLKILGNGAVLAYSSFNVDRDEDRVRLSNSAYKHLERLKQIYPPTYLKNDLDQFCLGLWEAKLEEFAPVMLAGTEEPTPPEFLLEPFIIREGGTIIFAPPGRGKSFTLLLMQISIDAGLAKFWPTLRARTLLINLERSARSIADRIGNINMVLGLDRTRTLPTINARGRSLTDVARTAETHIRKNGTEVVFVDSISRAGAGDLTANEDANRVIDVLNRIAPSWVGLAHTPRSDENHLYGSVHFEAGADVVVQLASEQEGEGPLGIGLQITKSNDIGKRPMWIGALEFDRFGLSVARHAHLREFPDVEGMRKLSKLEQVRQHLLDMGALPVQQICAEVGIDRSDLYRLFRAHPHTFTALERVGRTQRWGIVLNSN